MSGCFVWVEKKTHLNVNQQKKLPKTDKTASNTRINKLFEILAFSSLFNFWLFYILMRNACTDDIQLFNSICSVARMFWRTNYTETIDICQSVVDVVVHFAKKKIGWLCYSIAAQSSQQYRPVAQLHVYSVHGFWIVHVGICGRKQNEWMKSSCMQCLSGEIFGFFSSAPFALVIFPSTIW